jgi:hypothetical protein
MTSLAEAESKYGHVVQSAGGQIFGIERAASVDRQAEKLTIGTPDGFIKMPPRCLVWVATASRGADLVFLGSAESRFSAPA